jgi:hypothetical protein
MNKSYEHYSMELHWSELDNVFIVTVPELPGESQYLNRISGQINKTRQKNIQK